MKNIKLSKRNEEIIKKFDEKLLSDGMKNEHTRRTYTSSARSVLNLIKKDYDKINKNDLIKAFSTDKYKDKSIELMKTKFRHFLKFIGKNKLSKTYKLNFKILSEPKYDEEDILTPEEIKKLIDTPLDINDRALIEIMIATGGRRSEICYLKYGGITIEKGIVWLKVNGKTGKRRIPLVYNENNPSALSLDNFLLFYRSHKYKEQPEKPFFYSRSYTKKHRGGFMTPATITYKVEKFAEQSGIKRKITPHLLRHTCASYDGYHLSEQLLKLKFGFGDAQVKRYCHMDENLFGEHLLNNAGITKEQIKNDTICPNCKQTVHIKEKYCSHCNYVLDRELQAKKIIEQEKEIDRIKKLEDKIKNLEKYVGVLEIVKKSYDAEFEDTAVFDDNVQAMDQFYDEGERQKELKQGIKRWNCKNCGFEIKAVNPPKICPNCKGIKRKPIKIPIEWENKPKKKKEKPKSYYFSHGFI